MSAEYRPIKRIPFDSLFDCEFRKYGIQVDGDRDSTVIGLIGPNGTLFATPDGESTHYERHLGVDTDIILEALSREFGTEIVNEDDHRFWGFATRDEMDASFKKDSTVRSQSESRWMLIECPSSVDAEFTCRWLQSAIEADRLLRQYRNDNPTFRLKIDELPIIWNVDFASAAMLCIGMWLHQRDAIPFDVFASEGADMLCVMTAVGFFSKTGDRYQMTVPNQVTIGRIVEALYQLADTEDEERVLHPECLLSLTTEQAAIQWKRRLSSMPWKQRLADRDALLAE